MRNEDLWFNWAPSNPGTQAMQWNVAPRRTGVQVAPNRAPINTVPTAPPMGKALPKNNLTAIAPTKQPALPNTTPLNALVACNSCMNGSPVGVGMFPPGQCPPGSSTDKNPCISQNNAGCMDPGALNHNPLAITDDGSCQYPTIPPTTVPAPVFGCKDPKANNYNPAATLDGEPCQYDVDVATPDTKTAGIGGVDNKTLMYIGIGLLALLLLKK